MATLQIRGRNKPPVPDGMPGFGGGQVSYLRPSLLQLNQSEGLQNIDLLKLEDAVTRRGCDQLETSETAGNAVLGLGYFDIVGTEKLVRVKNTGTMKVQTHDGTPASSWTDAAGWTPSAVACDVVQGNNKLFFTNGTDNMRSWDGAAFTDMGTGYPNPPKYAHFIYATNRLIGWGDAANPDTLGFSNILGEGVWSLANTLRVGAGDGDEIVTCILLSKTLLAVLKRASAYIVNIDPAVTVANMQVDLVSKSIGCVGARAACKVGPDVWFYSDTGIRSLQRILQGQDTEVSPAISFPVKDVIDTVNKAALDKICCVFYDDRFLLAVPKNTATQPDTILPARITTNGPVWMGTWTGWTPTIFAVSKIGGLTRLNFGRSDGLVWRWRDFVADASEVASDFQDAGTNIATQVLTRRMTFGDPEAWKQGFTVELEYNLNTAIVSVYAVPDGTVSSTALQMAVSALGLFTFPITFPISFPGTGTKRTPGTLMHTTRFRELALLIASTAGKLSVRKVTVTAFMQRMEVRSA